MACILFVIAIIDWCTYQIPVFLNIILAVLGIISTVLDRENILNHLFGAILIDAVLSLFYYGTKKEAIGGGDIKLMAACGLIIGLRKIIVSLFFASFFAVIGQFILMKFFHANSVFAMAPYFAAGIFIAIFI